MIDRESQVREMEHGLETYDEELAKLRSTEKTLREATLRKLKPTTEGGGA
jgi:hypothetical protein